MTHSRTNTAPAAQQTVAPDPRERRCALPLGRVNGDVEAVEKAPACSFAKLLPKKCSSGRAIFNDRVLGRGQVTFEKDVSRPCRDFFYSLVRFQHICDTAGFLEYSSDAILAAWTGR